MLPRPLHLRGAGLKVKTMLWDRWHLPNLLVAFLLGRALLLDGMSPYFLPFFAVMFTLYRSQWVFLALASLLGASTVHLEQVSFLVGGVMAFLLLTRVHRRAQQLSSLPVLSFAAVMAGRLGQLALSGEISTYTGVMAAVEGLLAAVLALLMVQTIPMLSRGRKRQELKHEEWICLMILAASVLTGTLGWQVGGLTVTGILAMLLVMVFSYAAGGALGAAVGVITGLILGLADSETLQRISILAFAGLLGGLLKHGGRWLSALGVTLGTTILSLTLLHTTHMWGTVWECLVAIGLFFLIPPKALKALSSWIPGTPDHFLGEQLYVQRVRAAMAAKIQNFSQVMRQLAHTFGQEKVSPAVQQEYRVNHFLNEVVASGCSSCVHRRRCWEEQAYKSYQMMVDMLAQVEAAQGGEVRTQPSWREHCIKPESLVKLMIRDFPLWEQELRWRSHLAASRRLVADQLFGLAEVMHNFSLEISREAEEMTVQEQQIKDALDGLGLSIRDVEIYSLEPGNVHIEITQHSSFGRQECERLVGPLLSGLLHEPICVLEGPYEVDQEGYVTIPLVSERKYRLEVGIASAAKGGGILSGDSYRVMEISRRKMVVVLSDGMGNGLRAQEESAAAVDLLQELLQAGFPEEMAIQTINSVLNLRSQEEMYATVDLALIDLYEAQAKFLKVGSTPSFIKRGKQVFAVQGSALPLGILQEVEVEGQTEKLRQGDLLIMMTDGLFDGPESIVNSERWMKRLITEIETEDPQEFADLLLEYVVRMHDEEIADDMTVVVGRLVPHTPEWATIRLPHAPFWPGRRYAEDRQSSASM